MSVSDAVETSCQDDSDGSLERAYGTAQKIAEKLGLLIEILRNRGALNDANVMALLGGAFEKVNDDE
jgi:hypothetical protein